MVENVRKRSRAMSSQEPANAKAPGPQKTCPGNTDAQADGPSDHTDGVTVEEIKLRQLLVLQLQGRKQQEIARHFGVTERTIRNWIQRASDLKLAIPGGLDPAREVGRTLLRFYAREAELLTWKRDAEAAGDRKEMRACAKDLRNLEKDRVQFLDRLGLYARLRFPPQDAEDPTAAQADQLAEMVEGLIGACPGFLTRPDDPEEAQ